MRASGRLIRVWWGTSERGRIWGKEAVPVLRRAAGASGNGPDVETSKWMREADVGGHRERSLG